MESSFNMGSQKQVVYVTRPSFLDLSLLTVEALSEIVKVHFCIEISPESWQSGLLDVEKPEIDAGVHDGVSFLERSFPSSFQKYWNKCASISLIVYTNRRSIHPDTWLVTHQAMKHIRKIQPAIVHFDDVSLRLALGLFELNNFPIVLNIHDAEAHSGEHNWRKDLSRWIAFRKTKRFILHSNFSRKIFLERYKVLNSKVTMIPLGIYSIYREWAAAEMPEEPKTVLFFGRISPYKGVEVFIKAATLVAASTFNCRFIIAGKPITGYSLPSLPQLENGNRFEIYQNYLENTEVAQILSRSSFVVCPYLDASQSGVILTAYAFNKPVIASNIGGLPEYVLNNETGFLVPPGDPHALSESIKELLLNPSKRSGMVRKIMQRERSDLNWDVIARSIVNVYEKIV